MSVPNTREQWVTVVGNCNYCTVENRGWRSRVFVWGTMASLHVEVFSPSPERSGESGSIAVGQQVRAQDHWDCLGQAVLAPWAQCRVCVCLEWQSWDSAVSGALGVFHNRPWLTRLRYKGVCYTLECEKPSGHSHVIFQNSVRCLMIFFVYSHTPVFKEWL